MGQLLLSPPPRSWIEEADALARRIEQAAVQDPKHGPTWLYQTSRKPIGAFLNGSTGISLFLAALEYASLDPGRYRPLSLAVIARLRRQLTRLTEDPELASKLRFRLGGLVGLGSYIYALTRIGNWLGEPELVEEARNLTVFLTPERITNDNDLDVTYGSAGAVLALLVLHRLSSNPNIRGETPLDLARACGRHLLQRRSLTDSGFRAWRPAHGGHALCGFAHGATGIAYALLSLYKETGEEEFRSAALEGIGYESIHYNPAHKNWRDLRNPDREAYMMGWCSGAPGIALARSQLLNIVDTEEIRADLHNALTAILSAQLSPKDHLCCGNMSRVEALLESSRVLDNETLKSAALDLTEAILDRARRADGQFGLFDDENQLCFDPSLLCGVSGVGFTFLRLDSSLQMPSILLLQ